MPACLPCPFIAACGPTPCPLLPTCSQLSVSPPYTCLLCCVVCWEEEEDLLLGDRPVILRLGGGITAGPQPGLTPLPAVPAGCLCGRLGKDFLLPPPVSWCVCQEEEEGPHFIPSYPQLPHTPTLPFSPLRILRRLAILARQFTLPILPLCVYCTLDLDGTTMPCLPAYLPAILPSSSVPQLLGTCPRPSPAFPPLPQEGQGDYLAHWEDVPLPCPAACHCVPTPPSPSIPMPVLCSILVVVHLSILGPTCLARTARCSPIVITTAFGQTFSPCPCQPLPPGTLSCPICPQLGSVTVCTYLLPC